MPTLIAKCPAGGNQQSLTTGYRFRALVPSDLEAVGSLYFSAYEPGVACATLDEAMADIADSFAGEYGPLDLESSLVAQDVHGELVGAVLVVDRAPWPDTPNCPFVIELFSAHEHRRRGIATALVCEMMHHLSTSGSNQVSLRVAEENVAALKLYEQLGFCEWIS